MLPVRYKPATKSVIPGGFGKVQKVLDNFLGRKVLFKSMQDKAHNAQLINEIQALSKARSRHVIEIYDVITDNHGLVVGIVIELLEGREFVDFHSEFKGNVSGYLQLLYQIATALADLHAAGVVHRDLKLDNIRESSSGILKLFDFGISVAKTGYSTANNRGTLVYAAPELFTAGATITPEMDVYAFGVCAWALASSKFPAALLEIPPQKSGKAPSIDTVVPGLIPKDLVELIDLCMDTDPDGRPKAGTLSRKFGRHLVRGQHKGRFVLKAEEIYELSHAKPNVKIKIGAFGELRVQYDGLIFEIIGVTGDVFINNQAAVTGMELHEACVIGFGAPVLKAQRSWVSFTSSHPEVIL